MIAPCVAARSDFFAIWFYVRSQLAGDGLTGIACKLALPF